MQPKNLSYGSLGTGAGWRVCRLDVTPARSKLTLTRIYLCCRTNLYTVRGSQERRVDDDAHRCSFLRSDSTISTAANTTVLYQRKSSVPVAAV